MRAKGGRTERSDEARKRPHLALTCFIHVAETVLNVPNFPPSASWRLFTSKSHFRFAMRYRFSRAGVRATECLSTLPSSTLFPHDSLTATDCPLRKPPL